MSTFWFKAIFLFHFGIAEGRVHRDEDNSLCALVATMVERTLATLRVDRPQVACHRGLVGKARQALLTLPLVRGGGSRHGVKGPVSEDRLCEIEQVTISTKLLRSFHRVHLNLNE